LKPPSGDVAPKAGAFEEDTKVGAFDPEPKGAAPELNPNDGEADPEPNVGWDAPVVDEAKEVEPAVPKENPELVVPADPL
jgi:hypothetical protein